MRAARPLLFLSVLAGFAASVQSQPVPPGRGGINLITWNTGSPAGTPGGVNASVLIIPTVGWTCTEITIRIIDDSTNMTLGTYTVENPGMTVSNSFTGLGSKVQIRVTANATFQNGGNLDFKDLEAFVATQ